MPNKTRRTPIDYKPQFAEGIFRPKDVVEDERAAIVEETAPESDEHPATISTEMVHTTQPRNHATIKETDLDDVVETIRKAVKQIGKEAATYRFTPEEKKALANVVFRYKGRDIRTSENEVTRIAVHFLLEDYRFSGNQSILEQVLNRLNS